MLCKRRIRQNWGREEFNEFYQANLFLKMHIERFKISSLSVITRDFSAQ